MNSLKQVFLPLLWILKVVFKSQPCFVAFIAKVEACLMVANNYEGFFAVTATEK